MDDVIINSSETIINILNKKYNVNKTYKDLKDLNYKSLYHNLSRDDLFEIYNSDDYWKNVKIYQNFLNLYEKYKNKYHFIILNNNEHHNFIKAKEFIENNTDIQLKIYFEDNSKFYGDFYISGNSSLAQNFKSKNKIVLTNGYKKPWNQCIYNSDIYILNSWDEIDYLISFLEEE